MNDGIEELYDYSELRALDEPTMLVARVERPTLVLGGSQPREVLDPDAAAGLAWRRRRGGGGVVLLRPGDLWVDWWLPQGDARWSPDLRVTSRRAGQRWADVLSEITGLPMSVHDGPMEGDPALRVVCFAGKGPGEVFLAGRKVVGVTQWRVREGAFVSTVLLGSPSVEVVGYLASPPDGLVDALIHETLATLGLVDRDDVVERLGRSDGLWRARAVVVGP